MQHWVKYVVEVDLVGYFDRVDWEWLNKFRHRVNDGGLLRLVNKWLKAGVMENGVVVYNDKGTPQGGPISPVLSNVYCPGPNGWPGPARRSDRGSLHPWRDR